VHTAACPARPWERQPRASARRSALAPVGRRYSGAVGNVTVAHRGAGHPDGLILERRLDEPAQARRLVGSLEPDAPDPHRTELQNSTDISQVARLPVEFRLD